jgi:vacuolar-type H+-ATPase subunit B/Vma2
VAGNRFYISEDVFLHRHHRDNLKYLNFNYSSVQFTDSYEPVTISNKTITRRLAATDKNKSVGPDNVSAQTIELGGEAMIPYLARLLNITINTDTIKSDWKRP